ncbi:MAG: DNA cytosine methyltransferase [Verrucomicrobiae bacterium]|nr:DNA cytosine methyltransferase [Verrucomicrobiae bacterium]
MPIPVIDLFAGPGGLGEGFSALLANPSERVFKIKLSIEKDEHAHRTLELRAFFREFSPESAPEAFYEYLRGEIKREKLFGCHPVEAGQATSEAWLAKLGETPNEEVDKRIRVALGKKMENWVLIGGPPCQAYSLVGRSRRANDPKFATDEKHFLYREYLRILAAHKPPVFVMENVKGLLSAKMKKEHIFDQIRADLEHPLFATGTGRKVDLKYDFFPLVATAGELLGHFKPEDFVLRSEEFQIPQARHRIIILGVRSDWPTKPDSFLKPGKAQVAIEQVVGDLPRLRSGLSKEPDSAEAWRDAVHELLSFKWFGNGEIAAELRAAFTSAAKRVGTTLTRGALFLPESVKPEIHKDWFVDPKLKGVCNHETRSHIRADLHRYFFAAVLARKLGRSPLLEDFPKALLPKHENVRQALKENKFNDRFRVQVSGRPSTTVVSHIAKDGHYYIHYDPSQCRSLTVREAARLQTFPDNYFFEGPRTEQYHQVGNAVPPLLAKQIAEVVAKLFD